MTITSQAVRERARHGAGQPGFSGSPSGLLTGQVRAPVICAHECAAKQAEVQGTLRCLDLTCIMLVQCTNIWERVVHLSIGPLLRLPANNCKQANHG